MRELVEVAPGVLVATSRVMATTSTVLAGGGEALLVDPAWERDELDALAAELVRIPDELTRKRQLRAIREQAPVLHSLVVANMDKERYNAGMAGRQALATGQM